MKRPAKLVLIAVAALVALVIAAVIVVPIVMKGRVAEFIRNELNDQLDATVDFEDIDLSLLSTFPTLGRSQPSALLSKLTPVTVSRIVVTNAGFAIVVWTLLFPSMVLGE